MDEKKAELLDYDNLRKKLVLGRNELIINRAQNIFNEVYSKCVTSNEPDLVSVGLLALRELCWIQNDLKRRSTLWEEYLKLFSRFVDFSDLDSDSIKFACYLFNSYINEPFIEKDISFEIHLYNRINQKIKNYLNENGLEGNGHLLLRKSAMLRYYSSIQTNQVSKKSYAEEAYRCAVKGKENSEQKWHSELELASCYFLLSKFTKREIEFNERLQKCELHLKKSIQLRSTVFNRLALCQYYSSTYQPSSFVPAFEEYLKIEKNKRGLLRQVNLLAENTIALYYSNCDELLLSEQSQLSSSLLQESIDAGYSSARTIVNLCFISTIEGEYEVGKSILATLKSGQKTVDWNGLIEEVKTLRDSADLISKGFALGIDNAMIWNKLGTYVNDFLDDQELSEKLYRVALSFNKNNPIILTNLSRLLVRLDEVNMEQLGEADKLLSNAKSDFRFQWWRQVRAEITAKKEEFSGEPPKKYDPEKRYNLNRKSDLIKQFMALKNNCNTKSEIQLRGYRLEDILKTLFKLTLGNEMVKGSHIDKKGNVKHQNDGAFLFEKNRYSFEAKWTKERTTKKEIIVFKERLNVKEDRGLFVSINGFDESCIEFVKSISKDYIILLMDGAELEAILHGQPTFDEAIRAKQIGFKLHRNPYHHVLNNKT